MLARAQQIAHLETGHTTLLTDTSNGQMSYTGFSDANPGHADNPGAAAFLGASDDQKHMTGIRATACAETGLEYRTVGIACSNQVESNAGYRWTAPLTSARMAARSNS